MALVCKQFNDIYCNDYEGNAQKPEDFIVRKKETSYENSVPSVSRAVMCVKVLPVAPSIGRLAFHAGKHGHLDVVKWIHGNKKLSCDRDCFLGAAAAFGHVNILEWAYANGLFRVNGLFCGDGNKHVKVVVEAAARNGQADVLDSLYTHELPFSFRRVFDHGCTFGHVSVLEWMSENISLADFVNNEDALASTFHITVRNGHLDVLEWLHQNAFLNGRHMDIDGMGVTAFVAYQVQAVLWAWRHGAFREARGMLDDIFRNLEDESLLEFLQGLVQAGCPWGLQLLNYVTHHRAQHVESRREEYERILELGVENALWERD